MTTDLTALSLEERAALGSGADFWTTKAVGPVPSLLLTDGPHGVRRQDGATDHLGLAGSKPATCFPPAVGLGQSFDPDLVRRVGEALGREARELGVDVLLGPGINIKRDPRGGRNFEYYSEDPALTGVLGAAWVTGLQSVGVGASLKHFAANNAEFDRMRISSDIDPRTLREIYLRAFAHIVRSARPWTVMCSYNRINGVYASQNRWLLTDVLRGEWGFDGVVVSDWGAVEDRPAAVAAGLDLEMPGGGSGDEKVVAAVRAGILDEASVDRVAANVAVLADRVTQGRARDLAAFAVEDHHRLAREVAGRCVVLLRNERELLPLAAGRSLAVIGAFAVEPRYQSGGSSHVNPTRVDVPLEEIRALAGEAEVSFSRGFDAADDADPAALRAEAVAAAARAEVAVVFLGLGESQESEGFDRTDIDLPADQIELLTAVVQAQPDTVVVLSHGGVLAQPPVTAPAVLDAALLGQAGGGALADVLFGVVNPSARLAETVPLRLQDTPAYPWFPGENGHARYGEGLFVGYRWYDIRAADVAYPFGHGLSYTSFDYTGLTLATDGSRLTVEVDITNSGARAGREVVQVYTGRPGSAVSRPIRELAAIAVTGDLEPGASEHVSISVDRDQLAYWETRTDQWVVEGGTYRVWVGASSRDLRVDGEIELTGDDVRVPITASSTLGEVLTDPAAAAALAEVFGAGAPDSGAALGVNIMKMIASVPLNRLANFGVAPEKIDTLLDPAN
ncbi:glycoside hydrolase family 3 C-terminal domain-containing protein [Nocardia sp. NPDC059177]|uniref:glycoside hydrolase family 3 C-terminal domain-containing protein n=1 Tax=Nocardia sp. NPDC059177 TaxID=3346759 RepID=UPI0036833B18